MNSPHQPHQQTHQFPAGHSGRLATNSTLRNTWMLLAMTLVFATAAAGASMALAVPYMGLWTLLPYFFFLWMTERNADNAKGLIWVFALTGWLGFSFGPILAHYLAVSGQTVMLALGSTAAIFMASSMVALASRRDFGFLLPMVAAGVLVAFVAMLLNYFFFQIPALSMAISGVFVIACTLGIAWQTNAIVRGGETSYIRATVMLFVMLYNIFSSLLHLLGIFGDD